MNEHAAVWEVRHNQIKWETGQLYYNKYILLFSPTQFKKTRHLCNLEEHL